MKVGDLVIVDYGALLGIPCLVYSKYKGACKVYDPRNAHLRSVIADRVFMLNETR